GLSAVLTESVEFGLSAVFFVSAAFVVSPAGVVGVSGASKRLGFGFSEFELEATGPAFSPVSRFTNQITPKAMQMAAIPPARTPISRPFLLDFGWSIRGAGTPLLVARFAAPFRVAAGVAVMRSSTARPTFAFTAAAVNVS